jgi:hypothetical protein
MRMTLSVLAGAFVALAVGTGSSLAKTSEAPKAETEAASPAPCYSYEQNADGSWKQTPCEEPGLKPQPASKISTRDSGKAAR